MDMREIRLIVYGNVIGGFNVEKIYKLNYVRHTTSVLKVEATLRILPWLDSAVVHRLHSLDICPTRDRRSLVRI